MADRALAYLRVSTLAQETTGKNLESQLAEIKAYCEKNGYQLDPGDVFSDVVSGAKTDRAGYYQLLGRVERGEAQVLVAFEVSRFGRNGTDNAWLLVKAREYGFRVETVTGGRNFLADPESEFMFDILSAVAKYERTAILYRMMRGKRAAHGRGFWASGPAPVGYVLGGNRGSKRLVVNEFGELVSKAFELYADGASLEAVGRFMLANKVPGTWLAHRVGRMLDNLVYTGAVVFNGDAVSNAHPALVTDEVWERVQQRRGLQRYAYRRQRKP